MAPSLPDCRRSGLFAVLIAAAALLSLQLSLAAGPTIDKCGTEEGKFKWETSKFEPSEFDPSESKTSIKALELRQCSTLLKASAAEATGEDILQDTTWTLTGAVHLEFDGAVLDTPSATVVVADGQLSSVEVRAGAAQSGQSTTRKHAELNGIVLELDTATVALTDGRIRTVIATGAPIQFSYQIKKSTRIVQGRAGRIDYDAGTSLMIFSKDTSYTDGRKKVETQKMTYNLTSGAMDIDPGTATVAPKGDRVPAPRTPDRASAK